MPPSASPYWILDADGTPVPFVGTLSDWAEWMEANRARVRVADTRLGRFRVSTIFVGTDAAWPYFETMTFAPKDSGLDLQTARTRTLAEAEEAHARAVALVRSKL